VTTPALVVLGAGLSQRPLIERAQARGLTTCVVDGRTDRPAADAADVFVHQDFSGVPATIAALPAAGIEPLGICSMGSEQAVVPGARLAEALGLPGLPVSGRLGVLLMTAGSDAELDARTEAALAALHVIIEPMGDVEAMVARTEQLERERMGSA
jgi:hypothetical protein